MDDPCICHTLTARIDRLEERFDERIDRLETKIDNKVTKIEDKVNAHDKKIAGYVGGVAVLIFVINLAFSVWKG